MSYQSRVIQNRIKVIAIFSFCLLLYAVMVGIQHQNESHSQAGNAALAKDTKEQLFRGLNRVSSKEVLVVLPEANQQPVLLMFSSRFCRDCQKISATLPPLLSKTPNVLFKKVDVSEDGQQYARLIRTFKPISVPTLVFIKPKGQIVNVLYNEQTPSQLQTALHELTAAPPAKNKTQSSRPI